MDRPGLVNPFIPPDPLIIENFDEHLPPSVTLLKSTNTAKVYLVGSAHFCEVSQDNVSTVIRNVRPHYVMVELCKYRTIMLELDEETVQRELLNLTFSDIKFIIKKNGLISGLMSILVMKLSSQMVKHLGIQSGEFRRAFAEVKMLENCIFGLGDRPIEVTCKRALSAISWRSFIRLVCCLPFSTVVKKGYVEDLKQLFRVFVEERDIYLTRALQLAANHQPPITNHGVAEPTRVVGIVGMAHVPGIIKLWGSVRKSRIPPLMQIPTPSRSSQIIMFTVKTSIVGLLLWGAYKLCPKALLDAVGEVPRKITSLLYQVDHEAFTESIRGGVHFCNYYL